MTHNDPNDVMKIYSGSLEDVEGRREALADAGIESRIVGTALTMVFGGSIPNTNELWVHRKDVEKATKTIERYDQENDPRERRHYAHPTSSPGPESPPVRKEPYQNPDPAGG